MNSLQPPIPEIIDIIIDKNGHKKEPTPLIQKLHDMKNRMKNMTRHEICLFFLSFLHYYSYVGYGITVNITGYTMVDFKEYMHKSYTSIGFILITRSIGMILCSSFLGMLCNYLVRPKRFYIGPKVEIEGEEEEEEEGGGGRKKSPPITPVVNGVEERKGLLFRKIKWYDFTIHKLLFCVMFVNGIALLLVPVYYHLAILNICYFFSGMSLSGLIMVNYLCLNIWWKDKAHFYTNIMELWYGIGSGLFGLFYLLVKAITKDNHDANLKTGFWTASLLNITCAIPFLFLKGPMKSLNKTDIMSENELSLTDQLQLQGISPDVVMKTKTKVQKITGLFMKVSEKVFCFNNLIYFFLAILAFCYMSCQIAYPQIISSFITKKGIGNDSIGSTLISLFFWCFTLGRFIGIFFGFCISPGLLILIYSTVLLILFSITCIFSNYITVYWIMSPLFGFFMSVIYPSIFTTPKRLFNIDPCGIGLGMVVFGTSFSKFTPTLIIYFFEYVYDDIFLYSFVGLWFFVIAIMLTIYIIKFTAFKKYKKKLSSQSKCEEKIAINLDQKSEDDKKVVELKSINKEGLKQSVKNDVVKDVEDSKDDDESKDISELRSIPDVSEVKEIQMKNESSNIDEEKKKHNDLIEKAKIDDTETELTSERKEFQVQNVREKSNKDGDKISVDLPPILQTEEKLDKKIERDNFNGDIECEDGHVENQTVSTLTSTTSICK